MKYYLRLTAMLLLVSLLLCSCTKIEVDDTSATETKKAETTEIKETSETKTTEETTVEETTVKVPDDGKVHVEKITLDKYEVNITVGSTDMPMVTMTPDAAENKGEIWKSDNESIATVNKYGRITGISAGSCIVTVISDDNNSVSAKVKVTVTAASSASKDGKVKGATYIQGILVVNKSYSLPADYNPGVNAEAQAALNKMIAAAANEGITLYMASGFRSYERQQTLYNNYVARDGKTAADTYSARPGYSEHQTGLAFDLNELEESFGNTKEGKWIAANCWKYGFILRYPKGKESVTGYMYEPWHVRYLGETNAKKVYDSGLCLEEYLNIRSVYAN